MTFPNMAKHEYDSETDAVLTAELDVASIPRLGHLDVILSLTQKREVKTKVMGELHHWMFERAWCYWTVKGPGLQLDTAMMLWRDHGKVVRANGDCGCRSPMFWNNSFATASYHIDTQEGLNAFAETIRLEHARGQEYIKINFPDLGKE